MHLEVRPGGMRRAAGRDLGRVQYHVRAFYSPVWHALLPRDESQRGGGFNRFAHSAGPECMAVCLQALGNCELVFGNALGSSTVLGRYLGKVGARIFFAEYNSKMCRHVVCVCVSSYVLCVQVLSAWRSARIFCAADNSQGVIEGLSICRSWVILRESLGGHRASWG